MMKIYAGFGSREAKKHPEVMDQIVTIANFLKGRGWVCSSGGAEGADTAFQKGDPDTIVWRPHHATMDAYDLAEVFHPAWDYLNKDQRGLMARNGHIFLGPKLDDPVDFAICWTEGGQTKGGSAQGIRICKAYRIPLLNLGSASDEEILRFLDENS